MLSPCSARAQTPQQSAARLPRSAVSGCGKPTHPADLRPCRRLAEKQEFAFWDHPAPPPGRPQWLARCPKAELLMNQAGERSWEASALTNEGRGRGEAEGCWETEQPNLPHCPSWGQRSSGRARRLRVPQEPQLLSSVRPGRAGGVGTIPPPAPAPRREAASVHGCACLPDRDGERRAPAGLFNTESVEVTSETCCGALLNLHSGESATLTRFSIELWNSLIFFRVSLSRFTSFMYIAKS